MSAVRARGRELAGRLRLDSGIAVSLAVAGLLAAIAFVGNGGLQLGSATLVEVGVIVVAGLVVAAALFLTLDAPVHGGVALAGVAAIAVLTALSILWSLYPADSWVETNRTLAYLGAFAVGIAAVRLLPARWESVLYGVMLGLAIVCLYGLATKVVPGWLAEDEIYARLREPYGYWNAVGVTAAMGIPLCVWLGTRPSARSLPAALAHPLLGLLIVTMLLSFSRGSIVAAVVGVAIWLVLVPQRLKTLAVLLPAAVGAGLVTAWAFSQNALTDDRVALAQREDAGIEFGVALVLMTGLLLLAGVLIERRSRERPLAEPTRRKLGMLALGSLAAVPLVLLVALAFTDRGIGGTISDRWDDLTSEKQAPSNAPGRLIETGNVRTIYWSRALDVWGEHRLAGTGAGSFAQAQLRFRDQPTQGRHAHGYVHQTLADLGALGLLASLAALGAWFVAAGRTLRLRRAPAAAWTGERSGLLALALVAIVFGVHSAIDWTWFVPAVAVTGLFCAGWVAGRGPLDLGHTAAPGADDSAARWQLPRGRARYVRVAAAAGAVTLAVLAAVAVVQPWRADQKGDDSLALLSDGDFAAARTAAAEARDINPLSIEPYFEQAAIENAAGDTRAAARALETAVRVEPASPEAWRRLGEYYVGNLDQPQRALPVLRAALYLDPTSALNRGAYLVALRASELERQERLAVARAEARRRAARRRAQTAP